MVVVLKNEVYRADFDDGQIQLDEPVELEPNAKLLVTVIAPADSEQSDWHKLSVQGIVAAYSDDEPEYALTAIKEFNPTYERG